MFSENRSLINISTSHLVWSDLLAPWFKFNISHSVITIDIEMKYINFTNLVTYLRFPYHWQNFDILKGELHQLCGGSGSSGYFGAGCDCGTRSCSVREIRSGHGGGAAVRNLQGCPDKAVCSSGGHHPDSPLSFYPLTNYWELSKSQQDCSSCICIRLSFH